MRSVAMIKGVGERSSFVAAPALRDGPMSETPRTESTSARTEDERLIHALVSRDLITREEALQCRGGRVLGAEKLLERLVECKFLTATQAERTRQELSALLAQQIPGYELMGKLGQ